MLLPAREREKLGSMLLPARQGEKQKSKDPCFSQQGKEKSRKARICLPAPALSRLRSLLLGQASSPIEGNSSRSDPHVVLFSVLSAADGGRSAFALLLRGSGTREPGLRLLPSSSSAALGASAPLEQGRRCDVSALTRQPTNQPTRAGAVMSAL